MLPSRSPDALRRRPTIESDWRPRKQPVSVRGANISFEPQPARRLAQRIEFCCTPPHGSWPKVAEIEFSALSRQCLGQRQSSDLDTLQREIAAWSTNLTQRQRSRDWHMTLDDARSS